MLQGAQLRVAEAGALQSDSIEAVGVGFAFGRGQGVGQNILGDGGAPAHVGILADTAVLVHRAECAHTGMVFYGDVAGQGGASWPECSGCRWCCRDRCGCIGHDQAVAAHPGGASAPPGAPGDGHTLADGVVVADFEAGRLALVFEILRALLPGRQRSTRGFWRPGGFCRRAPRGKPVHSPRPARHPDRWCNRDPRYRTQE